MPGKPGAMALEGRLLTDHDGRIFVVTNGVRHWILNNHWIEESRYAKQPALHLTDPQLELIPLGGDITYTPLAVKIATPLIAIALFLFFFKATNGSGWASSANNIVRASIAALFIVAIGFREPYLLQHPRFWAEEGLIWFQYGSTHSVLKTLGYIFPVSNYMNLAANIGAILSTQTAAHFGLLYAPIATTWYSYLLQASSIAAIFFVPSRLFNTLWKAVAGSLIVLFAPTASDEVWLNSINSMSFLGRHHARFALCRNGHQVQMANVGARVACSFFCGFSSPYSLALLPLFVVSALAHQSPRTKDFVLHPAVLRHNSSGRRD